MLIDEVMTRYPESVRLGSTVRRAAELLAASEVGMLVVLDGEDRFAGVLTETDLLGAVLPDAEEIAAAGNSVDGAFGAFLTKGRDRADEPVDPLVVREAVTVARGVEVAAAAVVLLERDLRRIPVVEGRRVVGTVSRTDICRAVLAHAATGSPVAAAAPATRAPVAEETRAKVAAARAAAARSAARSATPAAAAPAQPAAQPAAAGTPAPARTPAARGGAARTAAARAAAARAAAAARGGTRQPAETPAPARTAAAPDAAARLAAARARAARVGAGTGTPRG